MKSNQHRLGRVFLFCLPLMTLAILISGEKIDVSAEAQQPAAAAQAEASQPGPPAQIRVRLPNFFGNVVSAEQREQIYSVQRDYAPKIAELEKQLAALLDERDAKVEAVLSPEQRRQVEALREAARRQRLERTSEDAAPVKEDPAE